MPINKKTPLLVCGLISLSLIGCKPVTTEEALNKARLHYEQGHLPVAILELKAILEKTPDQLDAITLLNEAYAQQFDYSQIRQLLEKSIARGINELGIWQSYVDALIHLSEFSLAESVVKNQSQFFTNAEGLALQGHLYAGLNQNEKADQFYQAALKINPDLISAHLGLAQEYVVKAGLQRVADSTERQRAGNTEKAISSSRKSTHTSLTDPHAWVQTPQTESDESANKQQSTDFSREAESHIAHVLKHDPENLIAHYLQASIAYVRGETLTATTHLNEVLQKVPDHPESLLLNGRIHLETGRLNQSAELLSRYLALKPDDLSATIYLSSIALRQQNAPNALTLLQPFEETPTALENIEYLLVLGNSYLYLQQADSAVKHFSRAQALAPDSALTNMYFAMGLLANNRALEAIVALEKVLTLEPANEQAGISLITSLIQLGDYEKARNVVETLRLTHSNMPMPHYLAGLIFSELNETTNAILAYKDAIRIKHGFVPASLRLAKLYRQQQQFELAIEVYDAALFSSPYHPDVLTQMAKTYADVGEQGKYLELLELARDRNSLAVNPRLILGSHYLRRANIQKAGEILQELTQIGATRPDVKQFMAKAFLSTGRVKDALTLFEELVQIQPDSPEVLTYYATALIRTGEKEKARKALQVAREIKGIPSLETLSAFAELELENKNYASFEQLVAEITERYPEASAADQLRGDAARDQNKLSEAIAAYEAALEKSDHVSIILKLAESYQKAALFDLAQDTLIAANQRHADDMRIALMLAAIYRDQGDREGQITVYSAILETFPDNAVVLNNLAWLYSEEDVNKAYTFAKRAHSTLPDHAAIQDTYGWFSVLTGRYEEGLNLLKQAVAQAPENAEYHYHLAEAQSKAGHIDSARKSLAVALASQAGFPQRLEAEALMSELNAVTN